MPFLVGCSSPPGRLACIRQAVHFKHFARSPSNAWSIATSKLAPLEDHRPPTGSASACSATYTPVDIHQGARRRFVLGAAAWEKLPNVKRLFDERSTPGSSTLEPRQARLQDRDGTTKHGGHKPQNARLTT
jgi:hypothetical protein